jgi:hypothetical protein
VCGELGYLERACCDVVVSRVEVRGGGGWLVFLLILS